MNNQNITKMQFVERYSCGLKVVMILSALAIILACQFSIQPYATGDVVFSDNFSKNSTYWDIWDKPNESAVSFFKGDLMMIVSKPNLDIITTNNLTYPDVFIQTSAEKRFGSDDNVYGLVCRYLNERNFYGFLISSDGYYGIIKVLNGEYELISSMNMEYSERIVKGKGKNNLSAVCEGKNLSLSVNGVEISRIKDSDLETGETGFIVGSFESEGEIAVLFDNFILMIP